MPNPLTQELLVDICRLMDINKDGLVDLNEFLESFRLAEKLDRCPSRTAVDVDETGVDIELLKLDDDDLRKNTGQDDQRKRNDNQMFRNRREAQRYNGRVMGAGSSRDVEEIELLDYERPRRAGLLESDI